jgi:hypothetical protein
LVSEQCFLKWQNVAKIHLLQVGFVQKAKNGIYNVNVEGSYLGKANGLSPKFVIQRPFMSPKVRGGNWLIHGLSYHWLQQIRK